MKYEIPKPCFNYVSKNNGTKVTLQLRYSKLKPYELIYSYIKYLKFTCKKNEVMENHKHFTRLDILFLLLFYVVCISTIHAQNGWELMKPMNIPKGGSQSCVIDKTIYVFGGANKNLAATLNSAEAYDTEMNEWSNLESMPLDLYECNAVAINDIIYIVGGWRKSGETYFTSNSTFEYNPERDGWKAKRDCPVNTGTNCSCVLNDKLYIFGGLKNFADVDTSGQKQAIVYDPVMDTWTSLPPMLYERGEGAAASVFDNKIYVFGGLHGISETPERLYIVGKSEMYDPTSNLWTELANIPIPVVNHISVAHNNKIYLFGGDIGTFTTKESFGSNIIQEYDPSTDKWRIMEGMPFNLGNMTGQKVGNYVYIIGGYPSSRMFNRPKNEVWRFNLDYLKAR